jgi:hypothetical protein
MRAQAIVQDWIRYEHEGECEAVPSVLIVGTSTISSKDDKLCKYSDIIQAYMITAVSRESCTCVSAASIDANHAARPSRCLCQGLTSPVVKVPTRLLCDLKPQIQSPACPLSPSLIHITQIPNQPRNTPHPHPLIVFSFASAFLIPPPDTRIRRPTS